MRTQTETIDFLFGVGGGQQTCYMPNVVDIAIFSGTNIRQTWTKKKFTSELA